MPNIDERHRCEVRYCIRMGAEAFKRWAAGDPPRKPSLAQARGKEPAMRLWNDVIAQSRAGNRGERGEWKEAA